MNNKECFHPDCEKQGSLWRYGQWVRIRWCAWHKTQFDKDKKSEKNQLLTPEMER